jgi:hypothetical protein
MAKQNDLSRCLVTLEQDGDSDRRDQAAKSVERPDASRWVE